MPFAQIEIPVKLCIIESKLVKQESFQAKLNNW